MPSTRQRMMCMQLSTSVYRWPDDLLSKAFPAQPDLASVRAELRRMEAEGVEVFACGLHHCDDKGRCTGEGSPDA